VQVVHFIGHRTDVTIARYFFDVLQNQLFDLGTAAALEENAENVSRYRRDFISAAARPIGERLKTKREREDDKQQTQDSAKANALVHIKTKAIDDYMSEEYPNLVSASGPRSRDCGALGAGARTGKNIPLRDGIELRGQKQLGHRKGGGR
jgi:hypothetical protein